MRMISWKEFRKMARPGCRVPLVATQPLDLETPLAVYRAFEGEKHRFFLESVERGEKWGRYSFIGLFPSVIFKAHGESIELIRDGRKTQFSSSDPLSELKKLLFEYQPVMVPGLTLPMTGGAVGLVSYDMIRFFEKIPDLGKKGLTTPDLCFLIPEILLIADSLEQTLSILYDARIDSAAAVKKQYERGRLLINKVHRSLARGISSRKKPVRPQKIRWKASLGEQEHGQAIKKIKEYVTAGDITQAVFSIRFETTAKVDDLEVYRALRRINPSPYMFHFKCDGMSLVGASPETMVRLQDGEMTLRPIAGTRPRGAHDEEDRRFEKDLLADEKERAEHIMLVDLGRNDLGRVAEPGTVKVDDLMRVERYSHVMHIVSNVRARLIKGKDAFDVLRATFPAGTLSGSPKIRAMEIIEELEPVNRAFYGGCVGYFGFSGNMDMAITIRSALFQDGKVYVQSGGGIVADSQPKAEYEEVINKSKAIKKAVEMAAGNKDSSCC